MATQDEINAFSAKLQTLMAPGPNAVSIASLQTQIANLQSQLVTAQAQLQALQGSDGQMAQQVLNAMRQIIPNRVPGVTVP